MAVILYLSRRFTSGGSVVLSASDSGETGLPRSDGIQTSMFPRGTPCDRAASHSRGTDEAIAEVLDVSRMTIWEWRNLPDE